MNPWIAKAKYVARTLHLGRSGGGFIGSPVIPPTETPREFPLGRSGPNGAEQNQNSVRTSRVPRGWVRTHRFFAPPTKIAAGTLWDSTGREWASLEEWAEWVHEYGWLPRRGVLESLMNDAEQEEDDGT
jgi:hypothetical protein